MTMPPAVAITRTAPAHTLPMRFAAVTIRDTMTAAIPTGTTSATIPPTTAVTGLILVTKLRSESFYKEPFLAAYFPVLPASFFASSGPQVN